jgi:ATP-dependent RNA helicase DHX8/PRP22
VSTKSGQSEWKKATFNAATSFGRITSLSIQEQRESLPIYKLRNSLVQAIAEVRWLHDVEYKHLRKRTHIEQLFLESNVGCCW